MNRISTLLILILLILSAVSCSGGNSPISPDTSKPPELVSAQSTAEPITNTHLWGMWEFSIDFENQTVEAVPLRGVSFNCNVNRFINGPPPNLHTSLEYVKKEATYTDIGIDVGINHPFAGITLYTGFDVIGVFMGNGTSAFPDGSGLIVAGATEQQLLNADGYTRWFNAVEFFEAGKQMPLQGYNPGYHGTPGYTPTAMLNPYKYFADSLNKDEDAFQFLTESSDFRGVFRPGAMNHRLYDLRFPKATGVKFQYAVIAHWQVNDSYPNPPSGLDDFGIGANSQEALVAKIADESTVYFSDPGTFGGDVTLKITPWDWTASLAPGGAVDEYEITCWSPAWTGGYTFDMVPVSSGDFTHTFKMTKPVELIESNNPVPVWIAIKYPDCDYSSPLGIANNASGNLTSYFLAYFAVDDEVPPDPASVKVLSPNGGENLTIGESFEITWSSENLDGTVTIEYSKDDFVSDIHLISSDVENDGSCIWGDVPDDPSDTAKVRITSTGDPTVLDISDDYFSIFPEPVPYIIVAQPNGGEVFKVGGDYEITWTSKYVTGNVLIEYSKDNFSSDVNQITYNEPNDGSYIWSGIPDDQSDTVMVRVTSIDDPAVSDKSDNYFSIVKPSIQLFSPNGGETLVAGKYFEITWLTQWVDGNVRIEYSKDDFVSDTSVISSDELNDGNYLWDPVPSDPSTTVKIRVRSIDDPGIFDDSDKYFTIAKSYINVIAPNGGETWVAGSEYEIVWGSGYLDGNVNIQYSKDNFIADIHTIASGEANDGSCLWSGIPDDPSDTVKVRISSADDPSVFDTSDNCFSIVKPWILVLAPNGGEELIATKDYEILWNSGYVFSDVMIEYSKDDFSSDIHVIVSNTYNDGSCIWQNIPYDITDTAKIRISSVADPSIHDISDDNFYIAEPDTLVLAKPNGGETWYTGGTGLIEWTWTGSVNEVRLELSTNSGNSWNTVIVNVTECDGSYSWNPVTNIETTHARVRISAYANPSVFDTSNADFTITDQNGWKIIGDMQLSPQPYQYGVSAFDLSVHSNGKNLSGGQIVRQTTYDRFHEFANDYYGTIWQWNYVIPLWLQQQAVWLDNIRKFDTNITGDWIFVTNNDAHAANAPSVKDPMHGAFSANNNLTGEFSHNLWAGKPDIFFFGDKGLHLTDPDPNKLPWLYMSDFSSGVAGGVGGIIGDRSIFFLIPMSPLEPNKTGNIGLGYWGPNYDENSREIFKIPTGLGPGGMGLVNDTNPSKMALAVDDDTGLTIMGYGNIVAFWVLDSMGVAQAHILSWDFTGSYAVLPHNQLNSEEYGSARPVDIEILPAKNFGYEVTHFNWIAALLDNGNGTWSVGVWEFNYVAGVPPDVQGNFIFIDKTIPVPGIPQALDVDNTDFEVHVLYKKPSGMYAASVFHYIP